MTTGIPDKNSPVDTRCPDVRRWLQVFLDDEIEDQATVRRLASHLDLCQKCGQEARTLSELKDCLRKLQPPADEEALARLYNFVQQIESSQPPGESP